MSAQVIIFDPQYTSELIKNIEKAKSLVDEAMNDLKHAASHRGWRCPEVNNINDSIKTTSSNLKKINRGLTATANVLNRGKENFSSLETRSQRQAEKLSENLREKYGFSASKRGSDEKTNLPVTQIPEREDNFIVKGIKATAKNIIQGLGTAIGTVIGAIGNGINKAGEGFLTDVKDALIDPMINIFKASYEFGEAMKKQSLGDMGAALSNIATNAMKLIGSTVGLGGDLAEKGVMLGNLNKFSDSTTFIGNIYSEGGNAFDAGSAVGEVIKDPEKSKEAMNQIIGMVTDKVVPFGLDQTLIQGLSGVANGANDGANVGYTIATTICNFLGL